jgi:hypothetical protein
MIENKWSGARVFHPLNPQPTSWSALKPVIVDVLNKISTGKGQGKIVTKAPFSAWVERVREEAEKLDGAPGLEEMSEGNPAIKLLGFYEGLVAGDGVPGVDGKTAMERSEKLRSLAGLKPEWMDTWIQDWVKI